MNQKPDQQLILEARNIRKSFGNTPALLGASVSVAPGEIVAVMGPSGSGKSTLLHCLAGIMTPDSGEVVFKGQRLDNQNDETRTTLRRNTFGFIFQFGQLVPELTVLENIALPLMLAGKNRQLAFEAAAHWLPQVGLQEVGQHRVGEISGGQAQRAALARSLIASPQVLFADEPTGSLDSLNSEKVMLLLAEQARKQGTTVIIVTHDARVAAYADREIIVRDGVVIGANQ